MVEVSCRSFREDSGDETAIFHSAALADEISDFESRGVVDAMRVFVAVVVEICFPPVDIQVTGNIRAVEVRSDSVNVVEPAGH